MTDQAKTPSGRVPNTPLRNPRHELLCHAIVQGKSGVEAGVIAGYKPGAGLKGNIARLRQDQHIVERIAEVAQRSADLAEIYDGWVLADVVMFARGNLADFCKRDVNGALALTHSGLPQLDFSKATPDQFRVIEEFSHTKYGPKLKMRDPLNALDKLMRHRGLLKDKVEHTGKDGGPIETKPIGDGDRVRALAVFMARVKLQEKAA